VNQSSLSAGNQKSEPKAGGTPAETPAETPGSKVSEVFNMY
jgi:hypothetical protein